MPVSDELREWFESGRDRIVPRPVPVMPPNWMAHAIRLCRNGDDGLARYWKVVPPEHVSQDTVRCVCGAGVSVPEREFVECPGGCGRWFARDAETVWAARLPQEAPDA